MRKEELKIPYDDSFLSAVVFCPENGNQSFPIVCKAHGLVSNEFEKEEELAVMLSKEGIAYLTFHFTGFYESPGTTSLQTLLSNLDTIISFITNHEELDPMKIGLYGVSLGAAVAICHASRDRRVGSVALQAPLFDLSFMANYPEFEALWDGLATTGLVRLPKQGVREVLLKEMRGNNPLNCVGKISPRPLLIIAGAKDAFIPIEGIRKLYKNAKEPKQFRTIEKADHNLTNLEAKAETFKAITEFFKKQLLDF